TDYGTLVLAHLSAEEDSLTSAAEVATATGIALPTVSKLLKSLAKSKLVRSTRGAQGGYQLARSSRDISAADIIDALEGPVHITECSADDSHCDFESVCNVGGAWQRINVAIRRALGDISLNDLQRSKAPVPRFEFAGLPVNVETKD
ncbi:MAG: SUF system Fe-S cluster assembly regulator, partial [Woeseiaceae bacterium]